MPRLALSVCSVLSCALLTTSLAGCGNYVQRGSTLYADGRYIEAAEVFERTEYRLTEFSSKERAEYGLYRGMTLLVLGDLNRAHRWLAYAYEVERANPGTLRSDRRALLDRGWFELGQRSRASGSPAPPGTALAASGAPEAPLPERDRPRREHRPHHRGPRAH
ncbi:MAG: hypothetical protein R3B13_08125 [Polyangiaceae bacterium]